MKVKAEWGADYDYRTDRMFKAPLHEECDAPILLSDIGHYYCVGCGKDAEVTEDMVAWIKKRSGTKKKTEKCFMCGAETFTANYYRNRCNLKWELGHGECSSCGCKIIV